MSDKKRSHRRRSRDYHALFIIGWAITVLQIDISAASVCFLYRSGMVPTGLMVVGVIVLAAIILICCLLFKRKVKPIRWAMGALFALLTCVLLALASYYVSTLTSTLKTITDTTQEVTRVGVYVLEEDAAESIQDASGYIFGIDQILAGEETDNAVALMEEDLGSEIQTESYTALNDLADALLVEECGAIIMGEQYVEVISELDGYGDFENEIREIAFFEWSDDVLTGGDDGTEMDSESTDEVGTGIFTMYISGIDTYGSISTKSRSDVNIIAVINTNTKQIFLISTPRDYYVPLSISDGVNDKLTHAGLYGVQVSMDTLEMLYDIDLDYYFRVNFSGFEELIDALGGITVNSEYEFDAGLYHFVEGENEVDGEAALAFARERHSFSEGDRQRGRNQMAVITGVLQKMQTSAILYQFADLMSGLEGSCETNMAYTDLSGLVRDQIRNGGSWDIQTYSVDGTGSSASTYSMSKEVYVMIPDQDTIDYAKELIEAMRKDEIITVKQ